MGQLVLKRQEQQTLPLQDTEKRLSFSKAGSACPALAPSLLPPTTVPDHFNKMPSAGHWESGWVHQRTCPQEAYGVCFKKVMKTSALRFLVWGPDDWTEDSKGTIDFSHRDTKDGMDEKIKQEVSGFQGLNTLVKTQCSWEIVIGHQQNWRPVAMMRIQFFLLFLSLFLN